MITYGFNMQGLMSDVRKKVVALGKLKFSSRTAEIFNAKTNGEDALILKCSLGDDCLGFLNSSNESMVHIESISHVEYVGNRAEGFSLLMKDFHSSAASFTVDLVVETNSGKDVYLVTDIVTGDVLLIYSDVATGEDSDHNQYRDAKAMGLMD